MKTSNFKLFLITTFLIALPGLSGADVCQKWVNGNPILEIKPYWEKVNSKQIISCLNEEQSINVRDSMGRTPLHLASLYSKDPKVIKLLIQGGSKINARNASGGTALHDAASRNHNPVILETL